MTTEPLRQRRMVRAVVALAVLLCSVAAGMLMPVYTDEIGWRFHRRAAIDGGVDIFLNDICGPNTIAPAPWFMMPVRWFSALTNTALAAPVFIRLEGVLCAVAWIALLAALANRLSDRRKNELITIAAALLGLGLMPYLLVMSRPEQPLILTATAALLVALAPPAETAPKAWLRSGVILLLATISLSYHLKGVLYVGIMLTCMVFCARGKGTVAPRAVAGLVLTILALIAAQYWVNRFSCRGDALLGAKLAKENVAAQLAVGGANIKHVAYSAFLRLFPASYLGKIVFTNQPQSYWLPEYLFAPSVLPVAKLYIRIAWGVAVLLAVVQAARFVVTSGRRALFEPRLILAVAIVGSMCVWSASQINQPFYDAAQMLPMLLVATLLCLALPAPESTAWEGIIATYSRVVLVIAILSQAMLLWFTVPVLRATLALPGYIVTQPYSVSLGSYPEIERDIDLAMTKAGFPKGRRLEHLLIDDVTYLHLQQSYRPFHLRTAEQYSTTVAAG